MTKTAQIPAPKGYVVDGISTQRVRVDTETVFILQEKKIIMTLT